MDPRELTEADDFFGSAPLKSYNTFLRPRPKQLAKVGGCVGGCESLVGVPVGGRVKRGKAGTDGRGARLVDRPELSRVKRSATHSNNLRM